MTAVQTNSPVFIVGAVRSGTTLLRVILDHHPLMSFFGEFEYAVNQCKGDNWPPIAEYRAWLETDRVFQAHRISIDNSLSYERLVHSFLLQHAARTDKPIIGASVHTRFDLLPKLWPLCRLIHVLRDPRDVARSTIGMGWSGTAYFGVPYWIEAEQRWDRLANVPVNQKIDVRYEELVRAPESELARICAFLGVSYDATMLSFTSHTTYGQPDSSLIEQWKRALAPREVALIEGACGMLLASRGYTPYSKRPEFPGRIELLWLRLIDRWQKTRHAWRTLGASLFLRRFISTRIGTKEWKRRVRLEQNQAELRQLK